MAEEPNILFILTDQHRKDTLSIYNQQTPCQTPNLDALAKISHVFTQAYTPSPVCTPSRASLQTGLYPMHHGMITNSYNYGNMVQELADHPRLLSRSLASCSYQLGYTGKWHLGSGSQVIKDDHYIQRYMGDIAFAELASCPKAGPTTVGYQGDDFPGHGLSGYGYDSFKEHLALHGRSLSIDNIISGHYMEHRAGEVTSGIASTIEEYLVDRSIYWLDGFQEEKAPWFFQLNFWGPHEPYFAPSEFLDLYKDISLLPWANFTGDTPNKPRIHQLKRAYKQDWATFEPYVKHYYAAISHIDYQIGRLLHYLKEQNLYDKTMIIFSADHGESLGIHGGLCDKTTFMYEETLQVPLFIKMPHQKAMRKHDALVNHCDLYSTILETAGLERDKVERDGFSLYPILLDEKQELREALVVEASGIGSILFSQRSILYENYKYVFNAGDIDELYDLALDPGELNNLIDTNPNLLALMQRKLEAWMMANRDNLVTEFRELRLIDKGKN